jgi:VWFA-related protein
MFYRRFISGAATLMFALAATLTSFAANTTETNKLKNARVVEPINLAILVQDDLTSQLGNELGVTADFIRALPRGSRVMVGYITTGTLQVRQPFTNDLNRAAQSLRIPISSTAASAFNPYVEVIEALRSFNANLRGRNAVLLISDGLDVSRGFDAESAGHTIDLERAIKQATQRNVAIYTFYAPSVGLTGHSMLAASYGQSSLNRLAHDTGGKAFFQGSTGFVTFNSYFARLAQALNEQSTTAS